MNENETSTEAMLQAKGKTAPRITPDHIKAVISSESYFRPGDAGLDALRFQFLTDDHRDQEIRDRVRGLIDRMATMSTSAVRQDIDLMMALPGDTLDPMSTLTFCVLVLQNGFTVTGESACASPENFDADIGRKVARENAEQKIWMLEGYALKQRLFEAGNEPPAPNSALPPYQQRVITEREEPVPQMPPHQWRVVVERDELSVKVQKLSAFLVTPTYQRLDDEEQTRLASQLNAMRLYCAVLNQRIEAFPAI